MGRFKIKSTHKAEDKSTEPDKKIDMSLDAIIKLNKIETKKQFKAKTKTSLKKKQQKTLPNNIVTRRKNQSQKTEFRVTRSSNRRRSEFSGKVASKRAGISQRQKLQQQRSRKFRENVVNDRRNIQGHTNHIGNGRKQISQRNNRNQQRRGSTKALLSDRNQRNLQMNERTTNRRHPERSFEERLQHANANASKLTVVVNNPQAKLSPFKNPSTLDLIRMQLNNICAVIENHSLPELETSRLQRTRSSIDNDSYQIIPEARVNTGVSDAIYQNHSTVSRQGSHALLLTIQNRLDIPLTKTLPTLNERFSRLSSPIVVKCEDSNSFT